METETESNTRPPITELILSFIFAWTLSVVCGLSMLTTAVCFLDRDYFESFSFGAAFISLALAVLRYGSGAFVLGTMTRGSVRTWTAAIIYVVPSYLLRGLTFAGAAVSDSRKDEFLANPGFLIVMPLIYLLLSPFVSFYFLRIGEESSDAFSRPKAVLNISWLQWLWVLPFFLFQVIGVPSFLLLTLWKIDILTADVSLSILSLPALIPRIIVFAILVGTLMAINAAYTALSEGFGSTGVRTLKVLGTWLLLTAMQTFIILAGIGKYVGDTG